jgi:hypothetical protein
MHGYLGGPIIIAKPNVTSCRYIRMQPRGRGVIEMFFLEIRDNEGHGIRVGRYGWGRQRQQLFELLAAWIMDCQVKPDRRTRMFLDSMTRNAKPVFHKLLRCVRDFARKQWPPSRAVRLMS